MKIKIDRQLTLLAALKDRVKDQVIEMQRLEVRITTQRGGLHRRQPLGVAPLGGYQSDLTRAQTMSTDSGFLF